MRGETDRTLWLMREAMIFDILDATGDALQALRVRIILPGPALMPTVWEALIEGVQDV